MRSCAKWRIGSIFLLALVLIGTVGATAQITLADFDRALSAIPLGAHDRILQAIDLGLATPGFPASGLLSLIERLAAVPAASEDKELVLLLFTRALEARMSIDGLLPIGFDLADALEEGLPVEGVILEAFKGIAQGSPVAVIEEGIRQRLILLQEVRDLLFTRGIFRATPGGSGSSPTALPPARFDQLVVQIADAVSDYLEGGGSPFEGAALYALVADRLRRLPATVVLPEDVDLVLDRIGPADLTQVALAAMT